MRLGASTCWADVCSIWRHVQLTLEGAHCESDSWCIVFSLLSFGCVILGKQPWPIAMKEAGEACSTELLPRKVGNKPCMKLSLWCIAKVYVSVALEGQLRVWDSKRWSIVSCMYICGKYRDRSASASASSRVFSSEISHLHSNSPILNSSRHLLAHETRLRLRLHQLSCNGTSVCQVARSTKHVSL